MKIGVLRKKKVPPPWLAWPGGVGPLGTTFSD
jgi:hypothetical protein